MSHVLYSFDLELYPFIFLALSQSDMQLLLSWLWSVQMQFAIHQSGGAHDPQPGAWKRNNEVLSGYRGYTNDLIG